MRLLLVEKFKILQKVQKVTIILDSRLNFKEHLEMIFIGLIPKLQDLLPRK